MTKEKWILIAVGIMDTALVIMYFLDYVVLFLKPTGYIIPLIINIVFIIWFIVKKVGFKVWKATIIIGVLFIGLPIVLFHGLLILIKDFSYTEIDNPYQRQSLTIEYRRITLGETTYFYDFYKTTFGLIGKRLDSQKLEIHDRDYVSGIDAEGELGLGNEEWLNKNIVRFHTRKGIKDVYIDESTPPIVDEEEAKEMIETFIEKAKNKEDGETITLNGNRLTVRYDEPSGQEWIDIANETGAGPIPMQQCSRIVPNKEHGYYLLEECTHRWEYSLYPLE